MEDSILDYPTHATQELMEQLTPLPVEEHDNLILKHITKISEDPSVTSILDPKEKAEWISVAVNQTLASFCVGHVALLDFFTYCCINCQHVLPDLNDLEKLYSREDGLTVVGIHSAKFDAERSSTNVQNAVKRLNIKHPVLNDPDAQLWNRLGIHCWPTLVLLGPDGKPILVLAGEGHRDILFRSVSVALKYYKEKNMFTVDNCDILLIENDDKNDEFNLKFPGKVSINPFSQCNHDEPWLAISDSGNNRIIITDHYFKITHIIGGIEAKLRDGNFQEARFNNPQGTCWLNNNILYVCDTGNHAVRCINLETQEVDMIAGTGVQAEFGDQGGLIYCRQPLASPWDIVLYKTADMDMSLRKPSLNENIDKQEDNSDSFKRVLLVACAGSHQIWAIFLNTTVWWKYKTYFEGTVAPIVGSGREENRNNRYPNSASLAQPSGLALHGESLYVADSESSSFRHLDLKTGQLSPLVGADRNPTNLFAFGDIDGRGYSVKLQHPLGATYCPPLSKLFIADTYNHKIKTIDSSSMECLTFYPTSNSDYLSEPGGLCYSQKLEALIVADTNNHRLVKIDVNTKDFNVIEFEFPSEKIDVIKKVEEFTKENLITCTDILKISTEENGKIILNVDCFTQSDDLHLTPGAPQRWLIKILDKNSKEDLTHNWEIVGGVRNGNEMPGKFEAYKKSHLKTCIDYIIRIEVFLSLCRSNSCSIKRFAIDCELQDSNDAKLLQQYNVTAKLTSETDIVVTIE